MNSENTEKLLNKYPKIFVQYYKPMQVTCMYWGFECGDGWFNLIDRLCEKIQNYVDTNNVPQVEATQVKEKFAGLRFYIQGGNEVIDEFIAEAEEESLRTCEICGASGKITGKNWYMTRCEKCKTNNN